MGSLTFTLHEVCRALAKTPIEGPAGVEASCVFRAAFNATAARMMTAVTRRFCRQAANAARICAISRSDGGP